MESTPSLRSRYAETAIMRQLLDKAEGQDVAEYAIMLAVVLVIVMGMVRIIGLNASTVFSQVGSAIQ